MEEELKQEEQTSQECAQCAEYLAGWKRAQADYANLKVTTDKEKLEFSKFANERLVSSLIPAIDQFETALAHEPDPSNLPDEAKKQISNWLIGLKGVKQSWEKSFKEIGLEAVPVTGPFNPSIHEAVMEIADETKQPGEISQVIQNGWTLNGKILRPAKVIIAK